MSVMSFLCRQWRDIPKTILFNFKVFDFGTALKFPVLVSHNVWIDKVYRGCVEVPDNAKMFSVKIGIEGAGGVTTERKGYLRIEDNAKIVFKGKASLSRGVSIRSEGIVTFGDNFYSNCNLTVLCAEQVCFGNNDLLGWNINIRDCDGHTLKVDGKEHQGIKPVIIKDNVWIGAYVDVMKGVTIPYGSVVAYRSCVLKSFDEERILIGGYPAKKLKEKVEWYV